ncbi:5-oxoprolinase/urea amidolyase family protein [Specibacter cremeus]|uniref:5-oxoprolinase subunit B/C family protein n=1 Tax=Specibacter cremeus TaxID=1629051 RepID=UPI000F78C30A|nr:5-oxoprolinase/urea amidolyase family protein [Specibacter cremeus]
MTDAGVRAILPAGDRAILVELDSLAAVLSLQAALQAHPLAGQIDVVAAASTVLVTAASSEDARRIAAHVRTLDLGQRPEIDAALVTIEVVYDGEDLAAVGELTGLGAEGVVAAHTGSVWTAAFGGFAPGFTYLAGGDARLEVPRRATPRTAVPAGAVALGGAYSAVYPRQTPGGWQLIGRTDAVLWDLDRSSPALIRPGNRVQFNAVRATALAPASTSATKGAPAAGAAAVGPAPGLVVVRSGLQTTIQDLGRPGSADLGVTASGAMDSGALRQANRLAGNPAAAAGIEVLHGGLALAALADQVLAVAGAPLNLTITDPDGGEREVPMLAPFALLAGETLELGTPHRGLRSYVAVRGGLDAPLVLGSRSTDTMSGIGPAPLAAGSLLGVIAAPPWSVVGNPELPAADAPEVTVLRMVPGPRQDWFDDAVVTGFAGREWTVTPQSNRIGLRLSGTALERSRDGELASEGTVRGALQVPPSGQPVLFLSDHPVTGGYPVIGVVAAADLDKAAQLPPGARVRFVPDASAAPVL